MTPGAEWCGQCYAVRGAVGMVRSPFSPTIAAVTSQPVAVQDRPLAGTIMSPARASEKQAFVPLVGKTRWRKTPTTFGPLGRLICTFLLVGPLPPFIVVAFYSGGFEAGGAVIWGLIVMPWGLKDVWKAGTIPLN
jgi:hypothetical protein